MIQTQAHTQALPHKIHRLDPVVAERIAAGEVIERPASVVKELIENSIDAQATEIRITLEDGGKKLIEILDNGSGMDPDDLELSVERHATSKLTQLSDLDQIHTLGFRGEALASISAVSEVQIISKTQDAASAYEITLGDLAGRLIHKPRAQKKTFGHFLGSPHGTLLQARGLFSQIPARLKFLKSQGAEVSQIREWIERLAIAHSNIGFQLISDDKTLLRLPASTEEERMRSILADGQDYPLLSANNPQDGMRDLGLQMRLYWLQGMSSAQARKLIQVVNGRAIRDRLLQQAILAPFRQALLPGQFPAVVLFVDINPAALDVNVHPSKTEIRFLDAKKIFQVIHGLVQHLIAQQGAPRIVAPERPASLMEASPSLYAPSFSQPFHSPEPPDDLMKRPRWTFSESSTAQQHASPGRLFENVLPPAKTTHSTLQHSGLAEQLSQARPMGTLFQTYLLFESATQKNGQDTSELLCVDQHAAHERVRYELLKKRILGNVTDPNFSTQALLLPEIFPLTPEQVTPLMERLPCLERLGFECSIETEAAQILFRAIPSEWMGWKGQALKIRLKNLIDRLIELILDRSLLDHSLLGRSLDEDLQRPELIFDEALFETLASEACHSAVRAGDTLEPIESQALIQQLLACAHPWNCPHGRPTVIKIPQEKFEEWFQRKL